MLDVGKSHRLNSIPNLMNIKNKLTNMEKISNYNKYLSYKSGRLKIESIFLDDIALKYGTPTFCYSVNQIKDNLYNLKNSFSKIKPLICYAMKANFNKGIVKLMSKNNLGVDVVSKGELKESLECGIKNNKIVFSGVGKTDEEINFALKNNIKQINVESEEELEEIGNQAKSLKRKINISLRVNPNVDALTHDKISTGRLEDKFGISKEKVEKVFRYYKDNRYLNINGLSIHIGSQICKIEPFRKAFKKIRNLVLSLKKKNILIDSLDIGGGIGIIYDVNKDRIFKISDYATLVEENFADLGVEIIIEPGRFLVGASGILISKVIRVKKGEKKDFLIVDAGMNNLLRPSLYNSKHSIFPVKSGKKKIEYDIVGPICETSDIFRKSYLLSKQEKNNLIIICSVGAYGSSMSSDYNLRGLANEILVDGNKIL